MAKKIDLDGLGYFKSQENGMIATVEESSTASKAYAVGDRFYLNGKLCIVTADIASGGTITLNTNCKLDVLGDDVSELKTALTPIEDATKFSTVTGTNLIPVCENGVGAYYRSGTNVVYNATYTDYHYVKIPVKQNTRYYISTNPRWWVLAGSDGKAISGEAYFSPSTKKFIDTENATTLYLTYPTNEWNAATNYGSSFTLIVAEGKHGAKYNETMLSSVNNLSGNVLSNLYACAMPILNFKSTVGIDIDIYDVNALSLDNYYLNTLIQGATKKIYKDHLHLEFANAMSNQRYNFTVLNENYIELALRRSDSSATTYADNVSDCSALVIGDSTVAQGVLTQKMLDAFDERSKTLTLLGTLGESPNNHEGRSGWGLSDYCTSTTNNPFYNPSTQKFDFSYYMTNAEYSAVDFVVLQLGMNDIYTNDVGYDITIPTAYYCEIINSILAWNSSQKIIINLPMGVNPNYGDSYNFRTVRNNFVRFNEYMTLETTKYSDNNVRISYCHLILNPESDINDNIHPNATGYSKMALEVVNQINCWQNG